MAGAAQSSGFFCFSRISVFGHKCVQVIKDVHVVCMFDSLLI